MNAVDEAIGASRAKSNTLHQHALQWKASSLPSIWSSSSTSGDRLLSRFNDNGANDKYALYRGWLYSAVHATGIEGASQAVQVGLLRGGKQNDEQRRLERFSQKMIALKTMPASLRTKAALHEFEIVLDHPLVDLLEQPNPVQDRWQFAYMFITNICLTGWGFVVGGEVEGGRYEFYALPSSWVRPDNSTKKPFTRFFVGDPSSMAAGDFAVLTAENVQFARIPNPAHPLGGLSPLSSQMNAVEIDQHIQNSQKAYFKNGIFPSVVLTVGKDPHPEVPAGIRPRLSNAQRRQIIASIKRAQAGVENYGEPAIIDGLIENITRMSATANEMGWEKSEEKIRLRILSAFGVHPYILGEVANVGGYAQAAKIEERFCKRVNVFLEMLSIVMTKFAAPLLSEGDKLSVWWEQCQASDPGLKWGNLRYARTAGDISKNEFRAELGYPPDANDAGPRSKILDNPNGMMAVLQLLSMVSQSKISSDAAGQLLSLFLQIPEDEAEEMSRIGVTGLFPGPEQVPSEPALEEGQADPPEESE